MNILLIVTLILLTGGLLLARGRRAAVRPALSEVGVDRGQRNTGAQRSYDDELGEMLKEIERSTRTDATAHTPDERMAA